MSKKTKTAYQTIGFWERNRRSQGYLLKRLCEILSIKLQEQLCYSVCVL